MSSSRRSRRGLALLACVLLVLPLVMGQACLPGAATSGAPTVVLRYPNLDQSVAVGEQVTIVYDALSATSVRGIYDRDGQANTGDETVFSSSLPTGSNQVGQLATATLPTGTYYLGVTASNASGTTTRYATGRITLVNNASITFLSPAQDLNVGPGVQVPIRFDAGLTDFTYRLFYDSDSTLGGNEITIAEGSSGGSSLVEQSWDTSALTAGTYYLGVTVTTTVGSSKTEYAIGRVIVVTGVYVQVLAPTVGLRAAVGDLVQIVVAANDPANPSATVRVYYDLDQIYGNGNEESIDVFVASAGGTVWDTTGVSPGYYYVGAALQNGQTPPPVSYSAGTVELVDSSGSGGGGVTNFLVTSPSADLRVLEGAEVVVRWYADTSLATGTVTLLRDADANDDQQPDGSPVQIATGLNPASREYTVSTQGLVGAHYFVCRLTMPDGTEYEATSRGRVIVRPPWYWVGSLSSSSGFAGCTLRGFNFQDLAGSQFMPAGDVDGDSVDDFVVISQYGKPGLVNPGGVGYGEAYLIFGNRVRLTGSYDLNRTGSVPATSYYSSSTTSTAGLDQGVIFSGVAVPAGSTETSGITSASMVPDMDGDGLNELIFAFAKADSLRLYYQNIGRILFEGLLENSQQFLRGGIVIVASTNSVLYDRSAVSRDNNRVIRLQEVGQVFDVACGNPDRSDDCKIEGSCGVQPCLAQVVKDGTKDDDDDHCNAYDFAAWGGGFPGYFYSWTYPRLSVDLYLCPVYEPTSIGMFRGGSSLEPYGCRILGQAAEDGITLPDSRFGTAVSTVRSESGNHLILISAPNQTADIFDVPELSSDRTNAGVVYALGTCNYWDPDDTTPISVSRPHQYIIKTAGYFTSHVDPYGSAQDLIYRPFYVVGPSDDAKISNVTAIPDFNGDGRMDFVVGSPNEGGGAGAAYIIFRRPTEIEGNYLLEKLALSPTNAERLNGVMIRGESGDRMGESITGGGDFNGDGRPDVLIGLPNHRSGRGAVLIVYGRQNLISPAGGFAIDDLVAQGYGALIVGADEGDLAGFNVTSAGDVDGDGKDDLLVAAPAASPMFDSNGDGIKDAIGLDYNGDGVADDLTNSGASTDLTHAGLVYVVLGSNTLIGEVSLSLLGTTDMKGFGLVGRSEDDYLGGGTSSLGLGARSHGLAGAGDVDGDGRDDMLIGAMLASPEGKTHAGETYLIYGGVQP